MTAPIAVELLTTAIVLVLLLDYRRHKDEG